MNEIPGFAEKLKQFGDLIDGEQVLNLVSQLFEYVFQVKHEIDRDFVGRGELHYLAEQKEFASGDWLVKEVGEPFGCRRNVQILVPRRGQYG